MECPFKSSAQDAISRYQTSVSEVKKSAADKKTKSLNEMVDRVDNDSGRLSTSVTELLTSQIMQKFPCVVHHLSAFYSLSNNFSKLARRGRAPVRWCHRRA